MAGHLPNQRTKFISRLDRLDQHLVKDSCLDNKLKSPTLHSYGDGARIRTFRWPAICRLVLLAILVMLYLGWIVESHLELGKRLIHFGQPLPGEPEFLLYRLLTGLTEAINACFWLRLPLRLTTQDVAAGRDLLRGSL